MVRRAAYVDQHDEQRGYDANGGPEHPQPTRRAGIGWWIGHAGRFFLAIRERGRCV
jgi:hypothetical protein